MIAISVYNDKMNDVIENVEGFVVTNHLIKLKTMLRSIQYLIFFAPDTA